MIDAIDKALSSLGEESKSAIYLHLERVQNLPKSEIPAKIDEFSSAIENLFGVGARFLEIMILRKLHAEVGVVWKIDAPNSKMLLDLTFKQYVSFVKKYFEDARQYEDQTNNLMKEKDALKQYR